MAHATHPSGILGYASRCWSRTMRRHAAREEKRMADVRPLPGIRYAADADLGALVTPPYDVISPESQVRYYERHPNNIIRLELGRDEPGDDALDNKYTRAAMLFAEW